MIALYRLCLRLLRAREGNIFMMTGFLLVPMIFAVGFGIDYSRAMRVKTILDAAADSAALSAVASVALNQSDSAAQTIATNNFNAQIATVTGITYNAATDLTIAITSNSGTNGIGRTATVTWRVKSTNIFSTILGSTTLALTGTAQATAARAPNVNYYLLLDTSPSMLLPSTSAGLSAIRSATSATANAPYGCAFACHTQNPHNDDIYIRNSAGKDMWLASNGTAYPITRTSGSWLYSSSYKGGNTAVNQDFTGQYADGYWLTRNYASLYGGSAITLRIDEERSAAQSLITTAQSYAISNQVTYKMQIYGFDYTPSGGSTPLSTLTSAMTDVASLSASSVPDIYAAEENWYTNNCPTSSYCNSDMGTEVTNALTQMKGIMPTPGTGASNSTPQQALLIITDGVGDQSYNGGRWNREFNPADLAQCTAIKNKGIMIGIIYTTYSSGSLTGDSWSQSAVGPYLANIAPALQSCASTNAAGATMYFEVSADGSVTDALNALFIMTLQTARLTR